MVMATWQNHSMHVQFLKDMFPTAMTLMIQIPGNINKKQKVVQSHE